MAVGEVGQESQTRLEEEYRRDLWLKRLWPLAILLHLAGNGQHLAVLDGVGALQLAVVGLAGWQLVRPAHTAAWLLATGYLMVLWLKLPVVGNHEIILGLFALVVLPSAMLAKSNWARVVGPAGRWIFLLSYGFIALSKLNRGFFDLAGSCALIFSDDLLGFTGLRPSSSPLVGAVVIVTTAAIEVAIPLLLLRPRFRTYGVALALGFHFVLALDPASHVWDFSATLLPLFLLFTPADFRAWLDRGAGAFDRRSVTERVLLVCIVIAGHGALAFGAPLPLLPPWLVAYAVWMAIGGSTLVLLLVFLHRNPAAVHRFPMFFLNGIGARPRWFSLWLVAVTLLAAANGVAPYLELRTAAAFNMYSNLRVVDGSSNHFLFNPGLLGLDGPISEESVGSATSDAIGDTPADPGTGERPSYVGIETVDDGSALDYYRQAELLVPSENLHRYLVVHQEESPTIRLGREAVSARSLGYGQVERDPGLGSAIADLIGRKLGFRRAIPDPAGLAAGGSGRCLREWGPIG